MTNYKVLVDLDSLLDTRLSLLFDMCTNSDELTELLHTGKYQNRTTDDFKLSCTDEVFADKYINRTKDLLTNATITSVVGFIENYINNTVASELPDEVIHTTVVVNTHPYDLDDDEHVNIILAMATKTHNNTDVTTIHKSPRELTPEYLSKNATVLIMYNFTHWLETHCVSGALMKTPLPGLETIVPLLLTGAPNLDTLEQDIGVIESQLSLLIGARFVPVSMFSTVLPFDVKR